MSRRNGLCMASNGWMIAMVPATTAVTNTPAPETEGQELKCNYTEYQIDGMK